MLHKYWPFILLTFGMLLQVSPAPLQALELGPNGFSPISIPDEVQPVIPRDQADLDGDGFPEMVAVADNQLSIYSEDGVVWQSPLEWQIVQAIISDLDHDMKPEVAILLWRPFQPWPVDKWLPNGGRITWFHDTQGLSCHIILIGWTRGGYHELWAGSAMSDPVTSFASADLDGDSVQELVVLESRYSVPRSAPAQTLKVWKWNGFGFTVVSSLDGTFSKMGLVRANNGSILILVP